MGLRAWPLILGLAACGGTLDVTSLEEGLKVCPKGAVTQGVDVSHYDGTIDWAKVKAAGIDFAIMKATENINFIDPTFDTNWKNAGMNGVIRGAYHFFRPEVDAVMQADYFVQHAGVPQAGDLPMSLDLEVTDNVPVAQVAAGALAFLQRVEALTGRTPLIYTSPSFFTSTLQSPAGFDSYWLWVANWGVTCPNIPQPPWMDWQIWQHSSTGTVDGITGMVDLDEFNGTLSDLQMWLNPPPTDDGGSPPDLAEPPIDAAEPVDAAVAPMHHDGCSCQLGAVAGSSPWWALLGPLTLAVRWRRSRRS